MYISSSRRTGYTSLMIKILKENENCVLVCGTREHAKWIAKRHPKISGQVYSLNDNIRAIEPKCNILYDNFTLERIQQLMSSDHQNLQTIKSQYENVKIYVNNLQRKNKDLELKLARAERALKRAGFQDLGGQKWKPPVNKGSFAPKYFELEKKYEELLAQPDHKAIAKNNARVIESAVKPKGLVGNYKRTLQPQTEKQKEATLYQEVLKESKDQVLINYTCTKSKKLCAYWVSKSDWLLQKWERI